MWFEKYFRENLSPDAQCRIGLHDVAPIIQSVTHVPKEDRCMNCGKQLATYKMVRTPVNDTRKRYL